MDFLNRIKKEMTEGIVRAILTDAGYRVIGLGIESVAREVECLTALEFAGLDIPKAMSSLPDLLVLDRSQTSKRLVEVKYRAKWSISILDEISEQVQLFGEIVLICVNGNPPIADGRNGPSKNLRCCVVRHANEEQEVLLERYGEMKWVKRTDVGGHEGQWWGLVPIQSVFEQVKSTKDDRTLVKAVQSLQGILNA